MGSGWRSTQTRCLDWLPEAFEKRADFPAKLTTNHRRAGSSASHNECLAWALRRYAGMMLPSLSA